MNAPTLASSAILLDLTISMWNGRKMDKKIAAEVQTNKNAKSSKAATVSKHLFADNPRLEAIQAHAAAVRQWVYRVTLPWDDKGYRLVPTIKFFDVTQQIEEYKVEFYKLVQAFLDNYDNDILAAAFKLGDMFDRNEYPTREQVERKFKFVDVYSPVPEAGDFRVDLQNDAINQLQEQFANTANQRLEAAMRDAWERLHNTITHIKDRLDESDEHEDGSKRKRAKPLHKSMLDNAEELCGLLKGLNIMQDPDLEAARHKLERALAGADIKDLRESPELRASVRTKMDDIMDMMNPSFKFGE